MNRWIEVRRSDFSSLFFYPRFLTIISLSAVGWVKDIRTRRFPLQKGANSMVEDTPPSGLVTSQDINQLTLVHKESRSWCVSENSCIAMIFTSPQDRIAYAVTGHVGVVGDSATDYLETPVVGVAVPVYHIGANQVCLQMPLVLESSFDAVVSDGDNSDLPRDDLPSSTLLCLQDRDQDREVASTNASHVSTQTHWPTFTPSSVGLLLATPLQ